MNICQKDIYLIFLNLIIIYLLYKDFNKKEGFDNISDIKTTLNQLYQADIEAIRNLSSIATQLTTSGLTVPGNLSISGNLNILSSGLVMAWTGNISPIGWLICDGTIYQISRYPTLALVLGKTFGGDGITTFAVPNYQGAFLRGVGTASNKNYVGPTLNTSQNDAVQNHSHGINDPGHDHGQRVTENPGSGRAFRRDFGGDVRGLGDYPQGVNTDKNTTGITVDLMNSGSSALETRPFNYGINWVIKI
jgi:hypothetical protein